MADLLVELKQGSGRTYAALAARTGMSRSTLHRYCQGSALPDTFAQIEALGAACRADRGDLAELFRLWLLAHAERTGAPEAAEPGGSAAPEREIAASTSVRPERTAPVRREPTDSNHTSSDSWALDPDETGRDHAGGNGELNGVLGDGGGRLAAKFGRFRPSILTGAITFALVGLVLVAMVASLLAGAWSTRDDSTADVQQASGPTWADAPQPVVPEFFGVTMNSDSGAMPGFDVGSVRLWDSGTTWAQLQPARGKYYWDTLDRLVAGAERAHLPVLFTIGGTPSWASPYGPRMAYDDGSRSSPPDDLRDWDEFIRALSTRYRNKIQAYELWVLAPSPLYYSGSAATLVSMTRRAIRIMSETDPRATIVCPSMGELWQPESRRFLAEFAHLGGYQDCEIAGVKLHPRTFSERPESILELTTLIDRTFHDAGVHPKLWSTGTTYRIATATKLDEGRARNYAVRLFLISLYGRYQRMYFYNWGGRKIPIVLQAEGGPPTTAARYVEQLKRWLTGARIHSCGHGQDDRLPANAYHCRFLVPRGGVEQDAEIVWTDRGEAKMISESPTTLEHLDGRSESLPAGRPWRVGEEPVIAIHGPSETPATSS